MGPVWHRFPDEMPPDRKLVLVQFSAGNFDGAGIPAGVAVAYLRLHSVPFFVSPGISRGEGRVVEFWCDCLPEGFQAPAWRFPGLPLAVVVEKCAVCGESDCGTFMENDTNQARIEHEPPYPLQYDGGERAEGMKGGV